MNNFSVFSVCSLSCTWMAIIDCLFYASGSLSRDVSWKYIANCVGVTVEAVVAVPEAEIQAEVVMS